MNPDKQRIVIAEVCGWTGIHQVRMFGATCLVWRGWKHFINAGVDVSTIEDVPDYLNDLNAIHEAESTLVHHGLYVAQLLLVVVHNRKIIMNDLDSETAFKIANSTAAQRAEAFLRTLGKWESDA